MFTSRHFVAVRADHTEKGDICQKDGAWLLVVDGDQFLVLNGSGRGRLLTLGDQYVVRLQMQGRISIGFADASDATSLAQAAGMQRSVAVYTDGDIRLAGQAEGEPLLLFDEYGDRVHEEPRIGAGVISIKANLVNGTTITIC